MRKYLSLMFLICLYFQSLYSQDKFTVIKVSGNIVIERTGISLSTGTSFAQNENLLFKIPDSRAAVINPQRGRFLITSRNIAEFRNSKSVFLPAPDKNSTRSFESSPKTSDLKETFKGNIVILNETFVKIDTQEFPINRTKYFCISYEYNNNTINKRLSVNSDTLIIKKKEVLNFEGNTINDSQVKLMKLIFIQQNRNYSSTSIGTFTPVFADEKTLKQEIKVILDQLPTKTYQEKINEISGFILEFYGKIEETSLKRWLSTNLGLRQ
jgi:hypothetical protein